jgi:abequosyltransferase
VSGIRLSICIPTYNFGPFIGETLESIVPQATDEVEVVVVDGASTDNTEEVVRNFQVRLPNLSYHRLEKKGGIDHDLARTVALARGDFCWLLSSDDVLAPGAVARVLNELSARHAVYLCTRTECDRFLTPFHDQRWLSDDVHDRTFTFREPSDFIDYFQKARSIGALFSYVSSIIVERNRWNRVPFPDELNGSNYAHVAVLFTILKQGGALRYIEEPLVLCRGGNDSFASQDIAKRFLIDFRGYERLSEHLYPDQHVREAFLAVLQREHTWYLFLGLRSHLSWAEWVRFEQTLRKYGYARWKLAIVRIAGALQPLTAIARSFWRLRRKVMTWTGTLIRSTGRKPRS